MLRSNLVFDHTTCPDLPEGWAYGWRNGKTVEIEADHIPLATMDVVAKRVDCNPNLKLFERLKIKRIMRRCRKRHVAQIDANLREPVLRVLNKAFPRKSSEAK